MRLALLADPHGNIDALREIMASIREQGVDGVVCAGDICGYYYHQNEVIDLLRRDNLICIRGNHDRIFLEMLGGADYPAFVKQCGSSEQRLIRQIKRRNLAFLNKLTDVAVIKDEKIGIFHGSPRNPNERLYPDTPIGWLASTKSQLPRGPFSTRPSPQYRVIVLGHTHYPMNRTAGHMRVINPGSCGMPRHGGDPTYMVLDTKTRAVELISVDYDRTTVLEEVERYDPGHPFLGGALLKGK